MKRKILALLCTAFAIFGTFAFTSCENGEQKVDYAGQVTLDMTNEDTIKQEVTVQAFIDGDRKSVV